MKLSRIFFVLLILIVSDLAFGQIALAQMSSASFIVPTETLGDAGGRSCAPDCGAPTSFILTDTFGDLAAVEGQTSASYQLNSGFQAQILKPVFTFSISSGAPVFTPIPSVTVISTAAITLTTTTNAPFGYTTTAQADGELITGVYPYTKVVDGAVGPAGIEEYGISVSGADAAFADDRMLFTSVQVVASRNTFGANRSVDVAFKLSMSNTTMIATYSQVVTFVSTPNY
ncbi:MAG: hypothetical protein V1821_00290 [bacterium]